MFLRINCLPLPFAASSRSSICISIGEFLELRFLALIVNFLDTFIVLIADGEVDIIILRTRAPVLVLICILA